jgi:hypothetical protein
MLCFADAGPGDYRLAIGLFSDRAAATPSFRLAIEGEIANGWHLLGPVTHLCYNTSAT